MEVNNVNVACHKCDNMQLTNVAVEMGKMELKPGTDNVTITATKPLLLQNGIAPISKIFIDDLTERKRLWRIPWFIIIMCGIQISFYVIANECIYQRFMYIPEHPKDYWRYLTYTLLHSDLIHLLLNVFLQCMIGFCLESEQGHWQVVMIYVAGGVSGSLATAYLHPELSLLGASASVYGLLASHVPHMTKNFRQLPHRYLRIIALLILSISDVGFTAFHYLVNNNMNPRICVEAHIAGGLAGLCFGFLFYGGAKRRAEVEYRLSHRI